MSLDYLVIFLSDFYLYFLRFFPLFLFHRNWGEPLENPWFSYFLVPGSLRRVKIRVPGNQGIRLCPCLGGLILKGSFGAWLGAFGISQNVPPGGGFQ